MMTPDALSALLRLMWEVTARIEIRFVMAVPEQDDAARSSEIEADDVGCCVIRPYPVAIALIGLQQIRHLYGAEWPRQQNRPRQDRVQDQNCRLELHLSFSPGAP
jgi:hypothetical protein